MHAARDHVARTRAADAVRPRRLLGAARDGVLLVAVGLLAWLVWPSTLGGCTTLTIVSGHSMEPTYVTGDLVVSRCDDPRVGDVVVYQPANENGGRVIHRIVGGDAATGWRMQGDNNDFTDPWTPRGDEVLGVARVHVPRVGAVAAILLAPMTWASVLVLAGAVLLWPGRREPADPGEVPDGPDHAAWADEGEPAGEHEPAFAGTGDLVDRHDPRGPHDAQDPRDPRDLRDPHDPLDPHRPVPSPLTGGRVL